jgi:hypothetical protein
MILSKYPFIEWLDLDGSGVLSECAVMKRFPNGDIYFFPLSALDRVDLSRLHSYLVDRNVQLYDELWKVLEQRTLGNGRNALDYFNQLVRRKTSAGHILPFGSKQQVYAQQVAPNVMQMPTEEAPSFDNIATPQAARNKPPMPK